MTLPVTADPSAFGFDPDRLYSIDTHFARYVDDGRLPGWQIVMTRRGEVVHSSTYGRPSGFHPLRPQLRQLVYSALAD